MSWGRRGARWPEKPTKPIRKRPMAWHAECLKNWSANVERSREELARAIERLEADEARLAEYEAQIAEAKKRGLAEFDRERFMKPRAKKAE